MTNLQFDLIGLREQAVVALERRLEAAETQPLLADSAVLLTSPLDVQLSVARHGSGAAYSGTVEGEWQLACVRCLGPARQRFRTNVEGEVPAGATTLDATEEVRQALVLALPDHARCRSDCKGLCPKCGANRNVEACGCAV
ncbi:MAG: DUF177 domain-containing protein [Elusimicrobia bacterium]|nr:DUF177 domain-containing protein [Elusimicrobiota bacterium]